MMDRPALDLKFFPAPEGFADSIATIYRLEINLPPGQTVSDLLLPEWSNLRFFVHGAGDCRLADTQPGSCGFIATGPSNSPFRFSVGSARIWGFGLLPLGWARLIRAPACELINIAAEGAAHPAFAHFAPLAEDLMTAGGDDWQDYRRLCDALQTQARAPRDGQRIQAIQEAMVDPYLLYVPDFAERAGVTVRTLERLCQKHFGFSPNVILRRQRLIRSLASFVNDSDANWSEAIDRHYHDQPHFVREFHHFMGMSPSEYAEQDHPITRVFMQNRQLVWGKPVRTSDGALQAAGENAG